MTIPFHVHARSINTYSTHLLLGSEWRVHDHGVGPQHRLLLRQLPHVAQHEVNLGARVCGGRRRQAKWAEGTQRGGQPTWVTAAAEADG